MCSWLEMLKIWGHSVVYRSERLLRVRLGIGSFRSSENNDERLVDVLHVTCELRKRLEFLLRAVDWDVAVLPEC